MPIPCETAPLRLCFVGPANNITFRRWVEWFTRRGHEATVLTVEPTEAGLCGTFRQVNLAVEGWPRKVGRVLSATRLALTLRAMRPQVIHAHYLRGLAWGLPWGRVHPTVVTPWGSDVLEEQGAFRDVYSRSLTRSVLTHADLVTVHSGYMEERVKPLVKARTPLVRIGWGVDLHRFRPGLPFSALAGQWKIEPWHKVIVSPRLAQPLYRHEVVIQALPQVLARVPETILVLSEQFADPAYVSSLKTLADDLGVRAQVRFVGSIPYEDMPLWLNRAQAVVMIPTSDGMPNTLLETMACGGVPILSRLPQYRDAVTDGREGFLIDPQPHTLADVLIRVLGDEDLRARMGVINRDKACRIADQDREMAMMEVLYHRLAAASSWC